MVEPVEAHGGTVHYAPLTCAREVLLERVEAESRRAHGKLHDARTLEILLDRYDLWSPVPFGQSLSIDTTAIPPAQAAARIVAHYGLPPPPPESGSSGVDRGEPRLHA